MFVDRQPALPLMRHWQSLIRALPDDPEPTTPQIAVADQAAPAGESAPFRGTPEATDERAEYADRAGPQAAPDPDLSTFISDDTPIRERPAPRQRAAGARPQSSLAAAARPPRSSPRGVEVVEPQITELPDPDAQAEPQYVPFERKSEPPTGLAPRLMILGAVGVAVLVIGTIIFLLQRRDNGGVLDVTLTVDRGATSSAGAISTVTPAATLVVPSMTSEPSQTPLPPSQTPAPSATPTRTLTPTVTLTPTASPSSTPTQENLVPTPTVPRPTDTPGPTLPPITPTPLSAGVVIGSPVPTNPAIVPPTAPPEALPGTYDLLALLGTLPAEAITWDTAWFAPGSKGWQLGNPDTRRGSAPVIKIGTDLLTGLLGTDAPTYLKRVDATLELVQYSPLLLQTGQVYFGVGLETARPPRQRADARARLTQENLLDLGPAYNGSFRRITQIPVTTVSVKLSVERNIDRTLSLFVNGQLLGQSDDVYALGAPLVVYLYTGSGGVIVNVTELKVSIER
jgi:hypothetical protein